MRALLIVGSFLLLLGVASAADARSIELDAAWFDCMEKHLGSLHVTKAQESQSAAACAREKAAAIDYKVKVLGIAPDIATGDTEYPLYRLLSVR